MKRYYAKTETGKVEWFETKSERDAWLSDGWEALTSTEARRKMLAQIWETDKGSDRLRGEKAWWERHADMSEIIDLYTDCCKYW